ncbi:MAG: fimbrial assembly family protein [Rhizobiaceae bacterium MnEN-MB40S]|nr:MAG: fimbrial assembly family protein [Rhizobiaceae bacterium MnEN-MB40S]
MRLAATVSDFLAWWLDELAGMFSVFAKHFQKSASATLLVGAEGSLFPVTLQKVDQTEDVAAGSIEELSVVFAKTFVRKGETLEISVDPGRFVKRKLADRRLPASRTQMMAEVDVSSNTPFKIEDVFLAFPEADPDRTDTTYFIFRKNDLQPLLQCLRRAGLNVASISVREGDDGRRMRQRHLKRITGYSLSDRLARWTGFAIVAVLATGLALSWYLEARRLNDAEQLLTARVDDARREAGRIRVQYDARMQLLDQMASIRNEKNLTNSAVYLWEQLSRTLPDDSWLTDMKIADGTLTVSGYSQSAASLISLIEDASGFSDPEFKSAVVKAPNVDAERFTLQASVDGQSQ